MALSLPPKKKRKGPDGAAEIGPNHKRKARTRPIRVAADFVAIPFRLEDGPSTVHYVYAKEQSSKGDDEWPERRSLFVSSLPVGSTKADIATALAAYTTSAIERVQLISTGRTAEIRQRSLLDTEGVHDNSTEDRPIPHLFTSKDPEADLAALRPHQSAVVIFSDRAGVRSVLKARANEPPLWPKASLPSFLELYKRMRPSLSTVQKHTDAWMQAFERREAAAAALPQSDPLIASTKTPTDADDGGGWTLVKRGGTHGRSLLPTEPPSASDTAFATGLPSVHVASRNFELGAKHGVLDEDLQRKLDKKRKKQEYIREGFYRFERDERRRKSLADMRARFDSDRQQVEERRRSRKFQPY